MIATGADSALLYPLLALIAAACALICATCGRLWRSDFYAWLVIAAVAAAIWAAT